MTDETQTNETRAPVKGEREGVLRGGVEWKSEVKCQTERKQSAEQAPGTEGELATGSGPISVGTVRGNGAGAGTKFRVLTRGGLSASATSGSQEGTKDE